MKHCQDPASRQPETGPFQKQKCHHEGHSRENVENSSQLDRQLDSRPPGAATLSPTASPAASSQLALQPTVERKTRIGTTLQLLRRVSTRMVELRKPREESPTQRLAVVRTFRCGRSIHQEFEKSFGGKRENEVRSGCSAIVQPDARKRRSLPSTRENLRVPHLSSRLPWSWSRQNT